MGLIFAQRPGMRLIAEIILLTSFLPAAHACEPFALAAMGAAFQLPGVDDMCCSAFKGAFASLIAGNPDSPMPWPTIAGMAGISSCTTEPDWGPCTDDAAMIHTGGKEAMGKIARHICDNWDGGCNVDGLTGTGMMAGNVDGVKKDVTKDMICGIAAPAAAPTEAPTPAPTEAPTHAPTTAAPAKDHATTAAPGKAPAPAPAPAGGEEASRAQSVTAKFWLAFVPAVFAVGSLAA